MSMKATVDSVRKAFRSNRTLDVKWRKRQLQNILRLVNENEKELAEALSKDLNKPLLEASVFEFGMIRHGVQNALSHIDEWTQLQRTEPPLQLKPLYSSYIQKQPYGTVLILGAWNYPYQLTFMPLIGAVAAGNAAIIKPSELSASTCAVLADLVPKYLDPELVRVVNGGIPETTELLAQKFDYIFYTGNTMVGKIVMAAAAKYMTPVTLECGGKNPVYVDESADMEVTARRLCWGRFANNGQTCVAPDYILCTEQTQQKLLAHFKKVLVEFYGEDPLKSDSYGRIINQRHFKRISALIEQSKVAIGGQMDVAQLRIAPTVLVGVTAEDAIMQEETFGPVLSFVSVADHQQAIDFILDRPKPLSLYVFSKDSKHFEVFKNSTSSGGYGFNEVMIQAALECNPFGGVGDSGLGGYHGKFSFDTFSHSRSVIKAGFFGDSLLAMRYPPYTETNRKMLEFMTGEINFGLLRLLFNPAFLMLAAVALGYYLKGLTQ